MKTKNIFYKNLYFNIGVLPVLFIFLLAFTAFYAHPNGEDLEIANISINYGTFNAIVYHYIISDGRYTTNLLHGFIPPVWGKPSYQYISALFFLISFIFSVRVSVSSLYKLFNYKNNKLQMWIITLFLVFCYTSTIPDLKYFMYLSGGGLVYGFSATILLLFLNVLYKMHIEVKPNKRLCFLILSLILLILVIGTNEMIMIFSNLLLTLYLFMSIISKNRNYQIIESIILLFIGISFSLILISAIGNGLDKGDGFNSLLSIENICFSILTSFKFTSYFIFLWIIETPLSFFLPFVLIAIIKHHINLKTILIAPIIFVIISIVIISITNMAYVLPFIDTITFDTYPPRIKNTGILFFMVISTLTIFLIDEHDFKHSYLNKNITISKALITRYLPILTLFLFIQHNTPKVLITEWVNGTIPNYNDEMNQRYETIIEGKAKNKKLIYLKTLKNTPHSLTNETKLSPKSEDRGWIRDYKQYFNTTIVIDE